MRLGDLRQNMLLPTKEIFINRFVKIRDMDIYLIAITSEEHRNVLWTLYKLPLGADTSINSDASARHITNRDAMKNIYFEGKQFNYINFSEIIFQNQRMSISSSSANYMSGMNYQGYKLLQHFFEKELIAANWDEVNLDQIAIVGYEQNKDEEFPEIDLSQKLSLNLKIHSESQQMPINQSISIKMGINSDEKEFYFYDVIEKKNHRFYINQMISYDIWMETENRYKTTKLQGLSKVENPQLEKSYFDGIERVCPKGMKLAILEYAVEDNIQLNFYAKEYLDAEAVVRDSACGLAFFSENKSSKNGLINRLSIIKPIEKDFCGSIEVELFSWYREIPEENIFVD